MGVDFLLEQNYNYCRSRKGGDYVAPRVGRPPKEVTKNVNIGFRITKETADKLQWCANELKVSRVEVIERGIDLVEKDIKK